MMSNEASQQCKKCGQEFEMLEGESDYCSFMCDPDMPDQRPPITREQVNEWAAENGFAMAPVEPTWKMECAGDSASHTLLPLNMATNIYKAMIKAAQDSS
jgi:hypothetical protein